MKLVTMRIQEGGSERETIGAVLGGDRVLDLAAASAAIPPDMILFLDGGRPLLDAAVALCREAEGGAHTRHTRPLASVRLRAPIPRPRKFLHTGVNFKAHLEEANRKPPPQIPGAPRFSSTIIGPDEPVVYPKICSQLDNEAEIAIVIGTRCKYVPRETAFDVIAGYTLYNDITARDIQYDEKRGGVFLGKNLDATNPIGPWIVTADEIPDPEDMEIIGRVDGRELQRNTTKNLIFGIRDLIAYYSQMTLEPGDLISTGTCEGAGIFRKPDPTPYLLKVGSVAEVASKQIGVLRNPVVAER